MARTNFSVSLDGVSLSAAQQKQLNSAIQRAALTTLAGIGIRNSLGVHFPNGGTRGIIFMPLSSEELKRASTKIAATRTRR